MSTTIHTTVGTPFVLDLEATPSSGYLWAPQALPDGIELMDSSFGAAAGAPPGTQGHQHFTLRAARAGHYRIDFLLKREWEAQPIATDTFSVIAR